MAPKAAFSGLRLEFLVEEQKRYTAAVANGTRNEAIMDIVRRYFKRFPPDLDHDTEPSEAYLAAVDDALPDPEPELPDPSKMSQEKFKLAMEAFEKRNLEVAMRTAQIERWLVYRHGKQNAPAQAIPNDPSDPMFVLTCRLLGKSSKKPRKPIAYNLWGKENRGAVKHAYASAPKDSPNQHDIGTETALKQALFDKQPDSVKKKFNKLAVKSHKEMVKEWSLNLKRPASTDPESRQVCIDGIASFMQPILNLVVEFTGMPVTFMMGGPEPAAQGRLNIIALHSGVTKGPVKMTFGEAESEGFHSKVVPVFSDFLRKCFTREDAQAAALPVNAVPMLSVLDPKEVTYCEASGNNFGAPKGSKSSSATKDTRDNDTSKQSSTKPSTKSNDSNKSSKKPVTSKQSKEKGKKLSSYSNDESESEGGGGIDDADGDDQEEQEPSPSERRKSSSAKSSKPSKQPVSSKEPKRQGKQLSSYSEDESESEGGGRIDDAGGDDQEEQEPSPSERRKSSSAKAKSSKKPSKPVSSKQPKRKGKQLSSCSEDESESEGGGGIDDADGDGQEEQEPTPSGRENGRGKPSAKASKKSSGKPTKSSLKKPQAKDKKMPTYSDDELHWEDQAHNAKGRASEFEGQDDDEPISSERNAHLSPHASSTPRGGSLPSSGSGVTAPTALNTTHPSPAHSPPPHSVPPSPIQSVTGSPASPILSFHTSSSGSVKESSVSATQGSSNAPIGHIRIGPPKRQKANPSRGARATGPTSAPPALNARSLNPTDEKPKDGLENENPGEGRKRKAVDVGDDVSNIKRPKVTEGKENRHVKKRKSSEATDVPEAKRRKVSGGKVSSNIAPASPTSTTNSSGERVTSSKAASMPALPPGCNAAIKSTLELAKQGRWGSNWDAVITAWLEFEASHQFSGVGRLGTVNRPPSISDWIQRARSSTYRPQFEVKDFETSFWKWWISLQPSWRKIEARTTSRDVSGDWGSLDKPGGNGLASVVAALFFWGHSLGERRKRASSWAAAVDDVTWVFKQLS